MLIAIDFDGTIADHKYPDIGAPVPNAFHWMKKWQEAGARLILWTMRSDDQKNGPVLTQAVEFCKQNGIEFFGINENPEQHSWTSSPKVYAQAYVDDNNCGCPLVNNLSGRPYVNWDIVGPAIMQKLLSYNR